MLFLAMRWFKSPAKIKLHKIPETKASSFADQKLDIDLTNTILP